MRQGGSDLFLFSQTHKLMAATKFSDYLGPKDYKKAKKIKYFIHFDLAYWPQSLSAYHSIAPTHTGPEMSVSSNGSS